MTKSIGQLFREKREHLGLTQQVLSKHLGLSSSQYISNIERGLCGPSLDTLVKLSELLRLDPHKLIDSMVDEYRKNLKQKFRKIKVR